MAGEPRWCRVLHHLLPQLRRGLLLLLDFPQRLDLRCGEHALRTSEGLIGDQASPEASAAVRNLRETSADEVYKTRYVYSFAGAAMMREFRKDLPMFFMFYGRLLQLIIKSAQYKLTRKTELAKSFGSDLRGFLDGCAAHKKFSKAAK